MFEKLFCILLCLVILSSVYGCKEKSSSEQSEGVSSQHKNSQKILEILGQSNTPEGLEIRRKIISGEIRFDEEMKDRIPMMVKLLQHEDTNVQIAVLCLFSGMGKAIGPALPAIINCQKSHDKLVRATAADVVENFNRPSRHSIDEVAIPPTVEE